MPELMRSITMYGDFGILESRIRAGGRRSLGQDRKSSRRNGVWFGWAGGNVGSVRGGSWQSAGLDVQLKLLTIPRQLGQVFLVLFRLLVTRCRRWQSYVDFGDMIEAEVKADLVEQL